MSFVMIAQLKFIATYLVPSVYPAMITAFGSALGLLLSQYSAPVRGSIEPWLLNLFAVIGVVTLLATLALTLKKLFGRQPSLTEILSGLIDGKTFKEYKEEQRLRCLGLEKQISDARHSFDERANSDLKHNLQMFDDLMHRGQARDQIVTMMGQEMSRLQERTETHIRTLGQYDTKLDVLRREISETVGALRSARERFEEREN